jgi:hypothetical protein
MKPLEQTAPFAPGDSIHDNVPFQITPQQRSEIIGHTGSFYIYGRIEYRDVFKKRRHTNFRSVYNCDPQGKVEICKEGNDYS